MTREDEAEVWLKLFCASLAGGPFLDSGLGDYTGHVTKDAFAKDKAQIADAAMREYRTRWSKPAERKVVNR